MRKKVLSAVLSMMMIAALVSPAFGAEFSSGDEFAAAAETWESSEQESVFSAGDESEVSGETIFEEGSEEEDFEAEAAELLNAGLNIEDAVQIKADTMYHDTAQNVKWYQFTAEEDGYYSLGYKADDDTIDIRTSVGTKDDFDNDSYYIEASPVGMEVTSGDVYYIKVELSRDIEEATDSFSLLLRSPNWYTKADKIVEGTEYSVSNEMFYENCYKFVPETTGAYLINAGDDHFVSVRGAMDEVIHSEYDDESEQFLYPLTAQETYYLIVDNVSENACSLTVKRQLLTDREYIEDILKREGALPQLAEAETGEAITAASIYKQNDRQRTFMQFIPKKTGRYRLSLYQKNNTSSSNGILVYNSGFERIEGVGLSFSSQWYNLEAGKVYYVADQGGNQDLSDLVFSTAFISRITSLKVLEEPYSKVFYKGSTFFNSEMSLIFMPGIKIEVAYEDGTREVVSGENGKDLKTSYGDYLMGVYVDAAGQDASEYDIVSVLDAPAGKYTFVVYPYGYRDICAKIAGFEIKTMAETPLLENNGSVSVNTNYAGYGWIRFKAPATGKYVFTTSNAKSQIRVYSDKINELGIPLDCIKSSETNSAEVSVEAGKYYYVLSFFNMENTSGWTSKVTISAKSTAKLNLSKAKVTVASSVAYTGKAVTPTVKVTYGTTTLKKGTDYTVSYSNNKAIGTATATIKGIGSYTGTAEKTFQIVLGAPTVKAASSAGYNAAKITWNIVPGAKSYTLYYKGGTVKSWKAVATNLTKTSYTHKSNTKSPLTTGTQYTYTVKAVNGKNVSTYGKSTKTVKPVPAAVKLGKVTSVAYNKQKITWNKVAGATGYIVYQKINGSWKSIATTKALSYINTHKTEHPVVVGVTNTYTVRAYRKVGKSNIYGGYSKTGISGKALLAKPAVSKITKTSKGLKLEWKKVSGAVGYVVQRYDSGKWVTKKTINSSKTLTYTDTTAKKGKTYKYRIAAFCKVNGKPFYSVYSAVKSGKR